jgi:hypothetical protein
VPRRSRLMAAKESLFRGWRFARLPGMHPPQSNPIAIDHADSLDLPLHPRIMRSRASDKGAVPTCTRGARPSLLPLMLLAVWSSLPPQALLPCRYCSLPASPSTCSSRNFPCSMRLRLICTPFLAPFPFLPCDAIVIPPPRPILHQNIGGKAGVGVA